jgi:hypothetical protein
LLELDIIFLNSKEWKIQSFGLINLLLLVINEHSNRLVAGNHVLY